MTTTSPYRLFAFLLLGLLLSTLYGCMTATEVREQIDESNAQILLAVVAPDAADLSNIEQPPDTVRDDYKRTAERIQRFIEQNPDLPAVTNPLRLRLAVLHMVNGQANLAAVTFDEVQLDSSLSERDLLIYNLRTGLVWWYELNRSGRSFESTDKREADTLIDNIHEQMNAGTVTTPALRAWLSDLGMTVAERRIRNFVPGESVATLDQTEARMTTAIGSYTGWWEEDMRADLKTLHGVLPAECPRSGIELSPWRQQLQDKLRTLRESGKSLELKHWSLFRWYPLFYCNTEDLQVDWLKSAETDELLDVSDWIQCTRRDTESVDVRCAPKTE